METTNQIVCDITENKCKILTIFAFVRYVSLKNKL